MHKPFADSELLVDSPLSLQTESIATRSVHRAAKNVNSKPERDIGVLKILIVGTPKTGNTWLKYLCAAIYDLPMVRLGTVFSVAEAELAGPRWVAHQHLLPTQELIDWGLHNHVVFLSAVRHPGDVLASLWHHIRNKKRKVATVDFTEASSMGLDEENIAGEHTKQFLEEGFHLYLNLSVAWLRCPLARMVRYESLWDRPLETLRSLTDAILPVTDERIQMAICSCELALMQSLLDPEKKFLRQGGVGAWRLALPDDLKQTLTKLEPYPQQFRALGYTMDEDDQANALRPTAVSAPSPFGANRTFNNGVPIVPLLMKAYFDAPQSLRSRWPDPLSTADDSFYAWLNRPAAAVSQGSSAGPVITELAYYIRSVRPDVREAFPDISTSERGRFNEWFLFDARKEYGLPRAFLISNPFSDENRFSDGTPVARVVLRAWLDLPDALRRNWRDPAEAGAGSFLSWLNSPAKADPIAGKIAPIVSELGAYLYSIRPDVAAAMPDIYGQHRVSFAHWFLYSARKEYALDRAFTLPVIRAWAELAGQIPTYSFEPAPSARDFESHGSGTATHAGGGGLNFAPVN